MVLKEVFLMALKEIVTNQKEIKNDIEKTLRIVLEKCRNEVSDLENLLKEKEKIERERNKLLDLCLKEIITDVEYKSKSKEIDERITKLSNKISEEKDKENIRKNIEEIINSIRKVIDNILNFKDFSKNVCKELVDKVIVYSNNKFDFYLKGYVDPFNYEYKSDILYSQR